MSVERASKGAALGGRSEPDVAAERVSVPVVEADHVTRLLLLTRLIASLNDSTASTIGEHLRAGLAADLIDKLRTLPLSEALDFVAVDCGISIVVDAELLRLRLARTERKQLDRAMFEHFIRCGASPQLIGRLFSVSQAYVRTARKAIAPATATGGRPRQPPELQRSQIVTAWRALLERALTDRERYYTLSVQFADQTIVSLEAVIHQDDRRSSKRRAKS